MTEEKPTGVIITMREIHDNVQSLTQSISTLDAKISSMVNYQARIEANEDRIRKIEIQNAAHWVVHTITIGGITAIIGRFFS